MTKIDQRLRKSDMEGSRREIERDKKRERMNIPYL